MKTVTAIEHNGKLYKNEDELADEIMEEKFGVILDKDCAFKYRTDPVARYSVFLFFRRNENEILELLKDRCSGKLLEEAKK